MIWVDSILMLFILSIFWYEPLINLGYMKKFRIVEKYSAFKEEYQYYIEELWLVCWVKPKSHQLNRVFDSCKDAANALEEWYLEQTTNTVIMEKEYEI